MNQLMVNDFVIASKSLLINDEIVTPKAMRAQDEVEPPTIGACATRNNLIWNEELVLTNIMRNNHRFPCESSQIGDVQLLLAQEEHGEKSLLHRTKVMCERTRL